MQSWLGSRAITVNKGDCIGELAQQTPTMNFIRALCGWEGGVIAALADGPGMGWPGLNPWWRGSPSLAHLPDIGFFVLLGGLLTGIVAWVLHRWTRQEIERRTTARIRQTMELIEHAPCALWEADVLLETGDWQWHIQMHPSAFCRQLFRGRVPGPRDDMWAGFQVETRAEMDRTSRAAMEGGKSGYEQEFRAVREGRTYWLREDVSITRLGGNRFRLVGLLSDLTGQREAEAARRQSEPTLERILAHAQCMIWRASVLEEGGELVWPHLDVPQSQLSEQLFGENHGYVRERGLWKTLEIPEQAERDERSRRAIRNGQKSYAQQYRAINRQGRTFWLSEQVSITQVGERMWSLVGVVTDITAQHEAEEAQRRSENRLALLLERADTMIWQARVDRQADGRLWWTMFVPRSQLYRRIFASDPQDPIGFAWMENGVPEHAEIAQRAEAAITGGAPGYDQVFHVPRLAGDIWLSESVTIKSLGPDSWDLVGVLSDITVRRQAEETWLASQARLSQLMETADCMVWESAVFLRPDDSLEWDQHIPPSALYRRIFGDPVGGQARLAWETQNIPEFPEMVARTLAALKSGAPGYSQEFHVVQAPGDLWLREAVTITPRGPGSFHMVGVIIDITLQHQSEAARRASEQRLQELLTRADCLLWEANVELTADDWKWRCHIQPSLLWRKLGGESHPQVEPGLWRRFEIPERCAMDELCRAAMSEGRPGYEQVFHIIRSDGTVIWIRENVSIHPLGDRRYSLVGVAVDITRQRGAEEALAAEKERLAVTLRAMHESVITTDIAGRIQFINPAAARLTEWTVEECKGRLVQEICVLEGDRDRRAVEVPVARVARGDAVVDLPGQTRLVTRSSRRLLVEGRCAPIHTTESKVTGIVMVLRDVTEQERLEQELVRATRLESVGVLAGGIAHDFNNILTAVMGNVALAQLDIPADSAAGSSLRSAEKAAVRARDLTQQLLTFAKGGDPVRAAVQLETVIREMSAFALHGSHVKAHYDLAPDLWPADADKGQIGRVVQNLVINAVQAMPEGGTLQISARNDPHDGPDQPGLVPGNYIQMTITDTGQGIKQEYLTRIFDPYFTTKKTGTGLGLSAVYSIIKKHHGHIEVESQPGQGTTFRFWLPALSGHTVANVSKAPWGGKTDGSMRGRVLFMDDEEIIRQMAVSLLEHFGLTADCVADGAEAVRKYQEALAAGWRYDLVIMDLTVPGGMGGLAAMQRLREIDPQVKAVVSSGYSSDPVLANYRQYGFASVMAKPYELGEVARVLGELLPG